MPGIDQMMIDRYLLDIERLKKLEPIMQGLGVKGEKFYNGSLELEGNYEYWIWFVQDEPLKNYNRKVYQSYTTYDYPSLESVLPDWIFYKFLYVEDVVKIIKTFFKLNILDVANQICILQIEVFTRRGQSKLEAMCDLVILLHENNIPLRSAKDVQEC